MTQETPTLSSRRGAGAWRWGVTLLTILVMVIGGVTPSSISGLFVERAAALTTSHLTLHVVDAGDSSAIGEYKYLINVDNTGNPFQAREDGCSPDDPGYPDSCDWPSIRAVPGAAPIFAQGNQDDFNGVNMNGFDLPDGKYLISVMANGYKLGGIHFTVPLQGTGEVTVRLHPHPLPTGTIRIKVFHDNASTNGQYDTSESGLEGFHAVVNDIVGQVSTDIFGNPLCTTYDAGGNPTGINLYGCLNSDANGDIVIPNLGPNRYDVTVIPPPGQTWLETTTLEGGLSWDTWLQEGSTGLDNEFVVAAEPFPWTIFGFVEPMDNLNDPEVTGGISGTLVAASVFQPPAGALPSYFGDQWTGFSGVKVLGPVTDGWVALSDLQNAIDQTVYVAPANPDGTFVINNVPDGNYLFTWWDQNLNYILDLNQVTVADGQITDMGTPLLTGWFTRIDGYVFNDLNSNGKRDPGEPGIADYLVVLKDRDNSEIDRMSIAAVTDANGYYLFEKAYPMGSWMILEAYHDRYYTTGVTYQVENQPEETTVLGAGVDVGVLPILGQGGRLDWGVRPYAPGTNGGIVGTVFYDVTRNELDAQYQAVEGWAPGIPGLLVTVSKPVYCPFDDVTPCDPTETFALAEDGSIARDMTAGGVACGTDPLAACDPTGTWELDGSGNYKVGPIVSTAITETWEQPTGCIARNAHGDPSPQLVLPTDPEARCLEAPLLGTQFQNGFATLDGNYGFDTIYSGFGSADEPVGTSIPAGDYLVEVVVPNDSLGRPMYQVVREEDINVFGGDEFIPAVPPPPCAGPMHIVDVAGVGADGPEAVDNPSFADAGGSPFEGMQKPLCNVKLVTLNNGKSIAPGFTFFTDVPLPGRWKGYIINDLAISTDPRSLFYGEVAGLPNSPIGVYDFTNNMVASITSDPNGVYEILLPSTYSMNCPTPSGVCPNVYYIQGNDPNLAGYNPQFRTIGTLFEIYPGLILPSDLAPTQAVSSVLAADSQFNYAPQCLLDSATPQLFRVSQPYGSPGSSFTITGLGFGEQSGGSQVTLDGIPLDISSWTDTGISATIPTSMPIGPHQLSIRSGNGKSTVNGLTFHVTGYGNFPANGVLDDFNRANGVLGADWGGNVNNQATYRINGNNVQVRGSGNAWWTSATYGANQEAYFTFVQLSTSASEQALLLKFSGNNPAANNASVIEVTYGSGAVRVRTKNPGQNLNNAVTRATFPAAFAAGDQLGAQAFEDGTVVVYKNGSPIGSVNVSVAGAWTLGGGRIGVRFNGTTNVNFARFDDFGGGDAAAPYLPAIYEVGPGKPYATIQSAVDAASASGGARLVVVYPASSGMYLENVVVYDSIMLQGVGPGGMYANATKVDGSVIDGRGVTGDSPYAEAWRVFVTGLSWSGNQAIFEGPVVYVVAQDGDFTAAHPASIDGFTIQGGDQQGFPNQINPNAGPANHEISGIQGGGIFVNGYARFLQITNNIIQSNGGAYGGAIRLGTPHLPGALNDNQNDFIRIAHNRILGNGGTNLAGAVAIYSGAEGYEIAHNDICGNFSAEYGGGVSHYGLSPDGSIHHNRVYFNRSYDEGGGIIIAGELPTDPITLSAGAGPVDVYANLIQNNLANDDGGGLRFLMAGNFEYNVYDNIIVNNVSTHEGGGVSLNDAPDVHFYNNTVMKNITTATALTSNGQPAPAGLASARNSALLQATLPSGSPIFSDPVLFNNIFWDNRAGWFVGDTVAGIGLTGDPNPVNYWDLGVSDGTGLLSPTNSILQTDYGTIPDASNQSVDPQVVDLYDTTVSTLPWRGHPRFVDVLMITVDTAPNLLGDYHLQDASPARDAGAPSKGSVSAPAFDIDDDARPINGAFDIGADEIPLLADLAIAMDDGQTNTAPGNAITYIIVVSNAGPNPVTGATVTNFFPASLTGAAWTCSASGGSCGAAGGSGDINTTVDLSAGGSATFTVNATVSAGASLSLSNTATIAAPSNITDPNPANNSATDTNTILSADLSISVTDGQTSLSAGGPVTYMIGVSNVGPEPVVGASVVDNFPASLSGVTWTCSAAPGSSCGAAGGSGDINTTVDVAVNGAVLFYAYATLSSTASGTLSNAVAVSPPAGLADPDPADNSATDTTDILAYQFPLLDDFNRANANNLGANWSQANTGLKVDLRVNNNQAVANQVNDRGQAIWNASVFGANQGASFTFANNTRHNAALILKASGGTVTAPSNFIRVRFQTTGGGRILVQTTTNGGGSYTTRGILTGVPFALGDTLTAAAYSDGTVNVYKNGVLVGSVSTSAAGAWTLGGGRIGVQLQTNGIRVDAFKGGSLP
ncbi:MAG: DUF11 domain-containing protein [Anaerolineales bacterium]|nr:DUF11 domain-containing protein [Anaerolineales bacterium]